MKKLLTIATLSLTGLLATPNLAQADHDRQLGISRGGCNAVQSTLLISGRARCGCPQYVKRIFRGRDRCGRPVFQHVRVPFRCRTGCRGNAPIRRARPAPCSRTPHLHRSFERRGLRGSLHLSPGCANGRCRL